MKNIFQKNNNKKINVLHIIPSIESSEGGTVTSVLGLIKTTKNCNNYLISSTSFKKTKTFYLKKKNYKMNLFDNSKNSWFIFFAKVLKFIFTDLRFKKIDLIHTHGVWNIFNLLFSLYAIFFKIPLIISPCGMLEPWALRQKREKKFIAYILYQKFLLKNAKILIAKSYMEYKNLKLLGFRKISVIPNGIKVLKKNSQVSNKKKLHALYLSRIHKKKGIYDLLISWSKIRPKNWVLNIVGTGADDCLKLLNKYSKNLEIKNIIFHGHLVGKYKKKIFKKSDLFILPSYSENFGNVILEALNYRIPVLTTKATPWNIISKFRCGWVIDSGEESLTKHLKKILQLNYKTLFNMGLKSSKIIKKFDYSITTKKIENLYGDLLK